MRFLILSAVAVTFVSCAPAAHAQDRDAAAALALAMETQARVAALEQRVTALEQRAAPAAQPQVAPSAVVVPSGMHAHRTLDGRVIVHSNANVGSAVAHAGIAPPWTRIAEAGQVVGGETFGQTVQGDAGCPNGNCPAAGQPVRGFFRNGGFFRRGR